MDQQNSIGCLQDVIIAFQKFRLLQIIQIQFRIHLSIWEVKGIIHLKIWRRAKESKKKDWLLLKLLGQLSRCESACVRVFHHIVELIFFTHYMTYGFYIYCGEKNWTIINLLIIYCATANFSSCGAFSKIFLFNLRPTAVLCCYCLG